MRTCGKLIITIQLEVADDIDPAYVRHMLPDGMKQYANQVVNYAKKVDGSLEPVQAGEITWKHIKK